MTTYLTLFEKKICGVCQIKLTISLGVFLNLFFDFLFPILEINLNHIIFIREI
ncbi:MAG: hypothetical protein BAJALOKI3v1_20090 [Promethearchaeota archaeon]|nr:MAG: hypothetical protein BAJALOKI3v1_20090 [Candidatus Lokiarchaeota archaeon]